MQKKDFFIKKMLCLSGILVIIVACRIMGRVLIKHGDVYKDSPVFLCIRWFFVPFPHMKIYWGIVMVITGLLVLWCFEYADL